MKPKTINLLLRISLFTLILCLGTGTALIMGETTGLALADLSNEPVEIVVKAPQNSTFYAVLGGDIHGFYRSDNYGRSWQKISQGPAGIIHALAVHPVNKQLFYASAVDKSNGLGSRLWSSQDGGQTWTEIELNPPAHLANQPLLVNVLRAGPDNPGALYVGTAGYGLYRFRPDSERYDLVGGEGMRNLYVKEVVVSPNNQLYVVTSEGVFLIDGNSGHKVESLPDAAVSLAIDPTNPQRLYVGTVGYGLHLSEDGGRTWQSLNAGLGWQPGLLLRVPVIAIDKDKPDHLALATAYGVGSQVVGDGIYESFNAGQHWVKIANNSDIVTELLIEEGGVYVATAKGLTRYGNPLPPARLASWLQFRSLIKPTGVQVLILILTVALAGWVLLGRLNWIPRGYRQRG